MRKQHSNYYSPPPRPLPPPLNASDVSAQTVVITIVLVSILIYTLLQSIISTLPSLLELFFVYIPGWVFGRAVRERLQGMFGFATAGLSTGQGVLGRVRYRAGSILGGRFEREDSKVGYVGGLWNMGNTCYQNSVLQAMASLDHLQPHLNALADEDRKDEGPFHSLALGDLIYSLNAITTTPRSITAPPIVRAGGGTSGWRYNEQQDAQEFFQRLTSALEKEVAQYWKDLEEKPGLEAVMAGEKGLELRKEEVSKRLLPVELRNPFEGLLAQRVGCMQCGYVEAIRMQTFTSLSLPLPSTYACTLEECLAEYTSMEYIEQVDCDRCSLIHRTLKLKSMLSPPPDSPALPDELLSTIQTRLSELESALELDDYSESTLKALKVSPKVSTTKTKHIMISRPPPVLVLHLNRSRFNPVTGMSAKNYASVSFPRLLNLEPWLTRHDGLDTSPGRPISEFKAGVQEKEGGYKAGGNFYELKSVIAHYGGHHNGHYVSYRKSGETWYKISDDEVYVCEEDEVVNIHNAFMIFYEQCSAEKAEKFLSEIKQSTIEDEKVVPTSPTSTAAEGSETETETLSGEALDNTADSPDASDPEIDPVVPPHPLAAEIEKRITASTLPFPPPTSSPTPITSTRSTPSPASADSDSTDATSSDPSPSKFSPSTPPSTPPSSTFSEADSESPNAVLESATEPEPDVKLSEPKSNGSSKKKKKGKKGKAKANGTGNGNGNGHLPSPPPDA